MENFDQIGQRYKTLLGFGKFFSFIGWLLVGLGALVFLMGFIGVGAMRNPFGGILALGFFSGLPLALFGIMFVAGGQGISCFVSIEHNTHATMLAQQAALNFLRGETPAVATVANTSSPTNTSSPAKSQAESTPITETTTAAKPFHCTKCGKALTEQEMHRYRGEVYCAQHYEKALG